SEIRDIGLAKLDEQRFGQGGEQASLERAGRLHLANWANRWAGVGAVLLLEECENRAGALEHGRGNAREPGDVDAVALIGPAWDDLVKDDDFAGALPDRNVGVTEPGLGLFQLDQLVVVGCEQSTAANVVVQVLGDRPGERDAVERAGAPADLVENDEA